MQRFAHDVQRTLVVLHVQVVARNVVDQGLALVAAGMGQGLAQRIGGFLNTFQQQQDLQLVGVGIRVIGQGALPGADGGQGGIRGASLQCDLDGACIQATVLGAACGIHHVDEAARGVVVLDVELAGQGVVERSGVLDDGLQGRAVGGLLGGAARGVDGLDAFGGGGQCRSRGQGGRQAQGKNGEALQGNVLGNTGGIGPAGRRPVCG